MEKKYKNLLWSITIDDYLEVIKMAKAAGVKEGESMEKYFFEYMKEKNKKPIGGTNKDIDQLTGEMRSKNFKVLNLEEEKRKRKYKDNDK